MAEGVKIQNRMTGQSYVVGLGEARRMLAMTQTGSGAELYRALGSMPAFQKMNDGSLSTFQVPAEYASTVARNVGSNYAFDLSTGHTDPRHGIAQADAVNRERNKEARDLSPYVVWGEKFWSDMTGGATSKLIGGTDERTRARAAHPIAEAAGTMTMVAATLAIPVPGLGALSKGGRIANMGNLFEASSTATQLARTFIANRKFGSLATAVAGVTAGATTAAVPIDILLSSANLVDTNKEYTASALLSEVGHRLAWDIGLGAGLGLAGGALGALGRGAKGSVGELLAKETAAAETAAAGGSKIGEGIKHGVFHRIMRWTRYGPVGNILLGDVAESVGHKVIRGGMKGLIPRALDSRVGRFLLGEQGDDFIRHARTNIEATKAIDLGVSFKGETLDRALETIGYNVEGATAARVAQIRKEIPNMRSTARRVDQALEEVRGLHDRMYSLKLKAPEMAFRSDTRNLVRDGFTTAAEMIERNPKSFGPNAKKVMKSLRTGKLGNSQDAIQRAIKMRQQLWNQAPGSATDAVVEIDNAIMRAVEHNPQMRAALDAMDGLRVELEGAVNNFDQFAATGKGVQDATQFDAFSAARGALFRAQTEVRKITEAGAVRVGKGGKEGFENSLERILSGKDYGLGKYGDEGVTDTIKQIVNMNRLRAELLSDASPLIGAAKMPSTQTEMLEMQMETVFNVKTRTADALKYGFRYGGLVSQGVAQTGVFLFRNYSSTTEKAEAFYRERDLLMMSMSSPQAMQETLSKVSGGFAMHNFELGTAFAGATARAGAYLIQQMPKSDDPMLEGYPFSSAEIDEYGERSGAISDPVSLLYAAADGSVTPESVDALQQVFPAMYAEMAYDVIAHVSENWGELSPEALIGYDTFLGGALGVTEAPQGHPTPVAQTPAQAQAIGQGGLGAQRSQQMQATMSTSAQKLGAL